MRTRELVPKRLQPLLRKSYLRVGTSTSGLRLEPSFMIIGGQRCGTTSLFKAISSHPGAFRPPVEKGIDYYTLHYGRGHDWYRGHFPLRWTAETRAPGSASPMAFEACTYYLFHPFALERIAMDYPDIKLVAMLRDPVERAFSAYKHETARGFEWETFERALDLEDERLLGEVERMRGDVDYESFCHRHHAYLRRGQYAEQLQRAFDLFPREQVHVLESESFFAEPDSEYDKLVDFLGITPTYRPAFTRHNARPGSPMPGHLRERLEAHYAPHDRRLAELLGRPARWMD